MPAGDQDIVVVPIATRPVESVTARSGYDGATSRPRHVAATAGYPLIEHAAFEVPLPLPEMTPVPVTIADYGCADGSGEMEPMSRAIDGLRRRDPGVPIQIVHTDLPQNDFTSLFELLAEPERSYLTGRSEVYPMVVGEPRYGPLLPAGTLLLGWTAITVHWLSEVPGTIHSAVFANLADRDDHARLAARSAADWERFLAERARELVPNGQLVVVAAASDDSGASGAEGLFQLVTDQLDDMTARGALSRSERDAIFFPTYNRTSAEFLAPMRTGAALADRLEVVEHQRHAIDDSTTHPQWVRHHDGAAFAETYLPFIRSVTEPSLFRWLAPERTEAARGQVVEAFYSGLKRRIERDPERATCRWRTVSLRIRRRP